MFVLRCTFKKNPFRFLIGYLITVTALAAYAIRLFERAYYSTSPVIDSSQSSYQDYNDYLNVLWLTAATMTTVGYGDYFCKSHLGRLATVIASMLGLLGISLMLVSIKEQTKLNQHQALSYEFIYKLQAREKIRHHSAIMLTESLRAHMLRKRLKVLAERQTIFLAEALDQEAVKAKLEKQTNEIRV